VVCAGCRSRATRTLVASFGVGVLTLALPALVRAQHPVQHGSTAQLAPDSGRRLSGGAMAVGVVTRARPAAFGATVSEGYLTQPMLYGSVRLANGVLQGVATLNLEGATLRRGEITIGTYGEGYIDRRHPHTWVHEAMVGLQAAPGGWSASVFGGKGFVPFGTDDPMVRPFVKYPVNHHHAQLMERVLVVGTVRVRAATLEMARFNGDEPEGPADWPNAGRAFDSWAGRFTVAPSRFGELSASLARVESPEFATGEGLDQHKRSVSYRLLRRRGRWRYGFVEWGRTEERNSRRTVFTFNTILAEGLWHVGRGHIALRGERTERPEEDRLADPYRSVRPLLDFNILGRTRWDVVTLQGGPAPVRMAGVTVGPFAEVGWLRPRAMARPAAFDPATFYQGSSLWMLSAGVRVHAGLTRPRWGRYGAAGAAR